MAVVYTGPSTYVGPPESGVYVTRRPRSRRFAYFFIIFCIILIVMFVLLGVFVNMMYYIGAGVTLAVVILATIYWWMYY